MKKSRIKPAPVVAPFTAKNRRKLHRYTLMLLDAAHDDNTIENWAVEIGVHASTIKAWNRKINWPEVLEARREKFARHTVRVDAALIKSAAEGDNQAIRTYYERFDNWTPETKVKTEHSVSEGEIDEALNGLIERKREAVKALDESGRPPTPQPDGREAASAEGREVPVLCAESGAVAVHSGDQQAGSLHSD